MKVFIRYLLIISVGVTLFAVTIFNVEHNSIFIGGTHIHTPVDGGRQASDVSADRKIDSPKNSGSDVAGAAVSPDTKPISFIVITSPEESPSSYTHQLKEATFSPNSSHEPLAFKGYLKTRDDTNTFTFALDSVCAVNIVFTTSVGNTGYYKFSMHDSAGTVLTQKMIDAEKLYSDTGRLYLSAGKYTLNVKQGYSWSGMPYTLNVNISQVANTEAEPNNSPKTANMIPVNESISSSTGTRNDIDYFVFTLDKPSLVKPGLDFRPVRDKEGIYRLKLYTLEILNADKNAFIFRGDNTPSREIRPFILEVGKYIISISRTESEELELGLHEYTLRVEAQEF